MKEEIKNATILGKTVRPDKAQMLKQVQHDMGVQDDMGWFRCVFFGALAPEKNLSPFTSHFSRKIAFTLAEVLITLGIIGVVAAMTLPSLILKHKKQVTATKLKKFYSTMSQAIKLAEAENGDFADWAPNDGDTFQVWYDKYLDKYIQSVKKEAIKYSSNSYYKVGLKDGSGFIAYISNSSAAYFFYCTELKYCEPEIFDGKTSFLFDLSANSKELFYPDGSGLDRKVLLNSCSPKVSPKRRHYCAALIQSDGWEIKDDYPWEQVMLEP